jgi:hypothetical protein
MQPSSRPSNPHEVLGLAEQPATIPASVGTEAAVAQLRNKSDMPPAPVSPLPRAETKAPRSERHHSALMRAPTVILVIVIIAIAGLSIWYISAASL